VLFCASINLYAQNDLYYTAINTSSATLVSDLKTRIRSPYTRISYANYGPTNVANFASYLISGSTRGVICVYSGWEYQYTGTFGWTVMSREHTWCQSWMPIGGSGTDQYQDQHHLFPLNQNSANGVRSNHPLGNVTTVTNSFYDAKLGKNSLGETVYEPRNSHKGDAARALLYMCIRYDDIGGYTWNFNWLNAFLPTMANPEAPQSLSTLLQWNKDDPPDKWEVERNNYVESIQKNRNPFIDHPEYVNYINFNDLTKLSPSYSVEPTNYLSNFTSSVSSNTITLNWTDAISGTQAPSGYLIEAFSRNNYFIPIDGSVYTDDTGLDSVAVVNVLYSAADTYTFSGLSTNKTYYFRVYSYNGDGALRNYKTTGTVPALNATTGNSIPATEPTNYVTNLSTTNITTTDITLNWTDAAGGTLPSGYLVLANNSNTFTAPVDGTMYTDDATLSDGTAVLNIAYGTAQCSFSSLNTGTVYYFKVYSYNGTGASRNYKTDGTVPFVNGTTLIPVLSSEPTNYVTNINATNITSNAITLTWTDAAFDSQLPSGYLILGSNTNSFTVPVDGTVYSDDPLLLEGSAVINLTYGTTQYTFTSLSPLTTYYFRVYSYNGDGTSRNYKTDGTAPSINATTLAQGVSQTSLILLDNFNRTNSNALGNTPTGTTSLLWSETETVTSGIQILSNQLQAGSSTAGRDVALVNLSGLSSYPTTLSNSPITVQWAFNFRTSRSDPSGFDNSNYGIAFILGMSSSDYTNGSGYAVVLGQSGTTNLLRLVHFSGGLDANPNLTDIISGGNYNSDYLSVKVTYVPSTNTWSLFAESSASSFPQSNPGLTATKIGTSAVNSTYTNTVLSYLGVLWNHNTSASENAVFDDIYISDPGGVLPVHFNSFNSGVLKNNVTLKWSTSSEINNSGFVVERILGSGNYEKVGFVQGKGTVNNVTNYTFNDIKLNPGKYKYRLKQVDYNGNFEFYYLNDDVEISVPEKFRMSQNYPNPFNPTTKIDFEIPVLSFVKLTIYDVRGREVKTLVNKNLKAGIYEAIWNAENNSSGIYFARIVADNFVKDIKLLLLK
jgi:endonuclease I